MALIASNLCTAQVARENPFGTGYFLWIDAGAGHGYIKVLAEHVC